MTCQGTFACVTGVLPGGGQISLCRLRYGGSDHSFGFAIFSGARNHDEDFMLRTGTPQEALDTACTIHLAGFSQDPAP